MLYVDNLRTPFGRMLMSHLIADDPQELRQAAAHLGLASYIQYPGTWKEHLDVSQSKRAQAIQDLQAQETPAKDLARILIRRRETEQQTQADSVQPAHENQQGYQDHGHHTPQTPGPG